jgi:hypothetical protein
MSAGRTVVARALALVLVGSCLAPAALAASLEGRWRLVEQRYEAGAANMMADETPLYLEFTRGAGGLAARMWAGADVSAAVPWPAFSSQAGPSALEVRERGEDAIAGEVKVSYRVHPSPGDDLVLEVTESYRVSKDGSALEGTLQVKFSGGERNRGGYTLHRRFEREK